MRTIPVDVMEIACGTTKHSGICKASVLSCCVDALLDAIADPSFSPNGPAERALRNEASEVRRIVQRVYPRET